jgi:hypothetical protein
MEDSKVISLIDKFATAGDSEFASTCQELITLIKKYLNKSKKINLQESEKTELSAYLLKRLLNGSTSDNQVTQDRYTFTLR